MININDNFPDFKMKNQKGEWVSNDDLKGKKTILYFYPRDNTPTCTTEACDFRDNLSLFKEFNTDVYGVSGDSERKHYNFANKLNLNFDLLVDNEYNLSKEIGVYQLKKSFGKENMGIVRTTFVIDEQGVVIYKNEKVKVKNQIEELKNFLKE